MRLLLVGTELAPVHADAGALELLLTGWAGTLAADHDVWLGSIAAPPDAPPAPAGVEVATFTDPAELTALVRRLAPDAVVANNRPGWQHHLPAPTLHLLHNWPDAWGLEPGGSVRVGAAGLAAVSAALASTVATRFGRRDVAVVRPWVDSVFTTVESRPDRGTVLFPNRLLRKKGVAELCAAAGRPALAGARVVIPDHLSPWGVPTAEHRELRALVAAAPNCTLVAPARTRTEMAALDAAAGVAACPSIRPEGLGLSAIEAQAAGVPVVSSGLGGLVEANLMPRLVVDPGDPDALAGALAAGLEVGAGERAALREAVAARFDVASSTRSLLDAIERAGH